MAITHFSCLHGTMYMAWLTQMSTIKSWWWILLKSINPIQHRHDVWHHALCQNLCWHGMSNRSFMSYVFQRLVLGTWHKMSTTQWPWDRMHLMKMIGLSNYKRRTMPRKAAQSQPAIKTSGALNKNCPPPIHSEHTSLYNCCLCNLITRKQMLSNHNYHHQMLAEETLFFSFQNTAQNERFLAQNRLQHLAAITITVLLMTLPRELRSQDKSNVTASCYHIISSHANNSSYSRASL